MRGTKTSSSAQEKRRRLPRVVRIWRLGTFATAALILTAADAAIPLKVIDKLPYIPVQVNGKTFLMMLDLGDEDKMEVAPRQIAPMQLKSQTGVDRHLNWKGEAIEEKRLLIPEMRIGAAIFREVTAREQHDASDHAGHLHGHIGLGLLRDYKIALDYRNRRMWLIAKNSSTGEQRHCQGEIVPRLSQHEEGMWTKVQTENGELTMVWDTGSQGNILRDPGAAPPRADSPDPPRTTLKRFSFGNDNFGPASFYRMNFSEPAGADGLIGYDFFSTHRVCFDVVGQRLYVSH